MRVCERVIYFLMRCSHSRLFQRGVWAILWRTNLHRLLTNEAFWKMKLLANTGEIYALPQDGGGINSAIIWMVLYWNSRPFVSTCADKFAVREYVRKAIGEQYLIPAIPNEGAFWTDPKDIDFSTFPEKFVLKLNNGSRMNMLVRDKAKMDENKVRETLSQWMRSDYADGCREFQYTAIPNKLICEKFLPSAEGEAPDDYKFMCSDGDVLYIWVDRGRYTAHQRTIYNANWEQQDVTCSFPHIVGGVARPEKLDEMLTLAKKLSKGIPFVRVDLYCVENQIYFGELTFSSGAAQEHYLPHSWSQMIASRIKLPQS